MGELKNMFFVQDVDEFDKIKISDVICNVTEQVSSFLVYERNIKTHGRERIVVNSNM